MNVKLNVLSAGVLFFIGQGISAQKVKKDTISTKEIDEVLVVGYGTQKKKEITGAVTSIKAADVATIAAPSFEQQLAGKAAGVQITSTTGVLGEAPRVRIRGVASINSGTSPLYIVDGIPIFSGDIGGQTSTNGLGDINPNDIESFEVLKDGASTAIYGSRAANGVILITTKKGKGGRLSLNFSNYAGYAMPVGLYKLLQTPEFIAISNEKRSNAGQSAIAVGTEYNTDWQKAVLRSAAFQTDNLLSASGSFGKSSYYTSIGYTKQEGVAMPNEMTRFSTRANIDHQAFDWLKIGTNLSFTKTDYVGLNTGSSSLSGNVYNAIKQLPNTPIYNPNHPTGYNIDFQDPRIVGRWQNLLQAGDNITNIMYVLDNNKLQSGVNRLIGSVYADVRLYPFLNYRIQVSADQSQTKGFYYYNPLHGDGQGGNGEIRNDFSDYLRNNIQNILTFNKTFAEKHNVTLVLVNEYQKQKLQSFYGGGKDLSNTFFNNGVISGSMGTPQSGGGITEQGILSYAARFNYNYAGKYFLQASVRRDGLSSLPSKNKWGNFPGVSAGWTVSKENFMQGVSDVISDLKLRASYAKVGNTDIGNYPYLGLFSNLKYANYNGLAYSQIGNDELRWETSKKIDYGVDLALFRNKLRLTFDYFENKISDMILDAPLALSLGVPNNSISKNIGDMQNKGLEFSVDYSVINTQNFGLDVNANVTFMKNKVLTLANNNADIFSSANNIIRAGESLRSIYGFEYWGVNAANGNPVYYKADGSLVQGLVGKGAYAVFNPSNPDDVSKAANLSALTDRKVLGSSLPKYFGGFSFKFRFYDFDLGTTIRFSGGNKIFNATRRDLMTLNFNNNSTEILGRWQSPSNPGDGMTPKLFFADNTLSNSTSNASSRFLEDASFIKFDVISLGYNFPKEALKAIGVRSLRIYFQAQNAFIITKYKGLDPEMESAGVDFNGTPRQRVFSMGLNVSL
ncbi:SusC/RagA family TonB-linked outer membrane protein [Chryseobacterium sp. BIGb0232]|uniref:SusC/RagA family TonB-linked outer membrane protein n=1 Tax=Chryseobacterium sp. BIGb0232 TaxID=2940598 RepID=UPI000F4A7711|nr:SusC/RagA family TonB-linked outer membrane protein [Chryseobacterium sp. BIGb0232]MCS4301432.1 TonB-linked SusC/RagA family outer membrane protein [Chryseobacterium sp. BIGb0232]ROS19711.1 TonB-linked SusC/RagA family outer membrane protein [Chryseobacterium nakagawai]